MFGTFHNCLFVKIKPEYKEHARKVMHGIWGAGQLAWTKKLVIVNETVNVHNEREVFDVMSGIDIHNDIEVVRGALDILDHASPEIGAGGKIGIDATVSKPKDGAVKIISVKKEIGGDSAIAIENSHQKNPNASMIFAVDDGLDINKLGEVFFHFAACFDPLRDMHFFETCIGFDGTTKMKGDERNGKAVRPWPPKLVLDDCD
jgi:3-polyprenyl-4-hydroxybenzoate decarboxylase